MENIFHRFLASRLFICFLEVRFSESTKSSARSIQLFCLSTTAALPALATSWAQSGWPRPASAASWPHSGWPYPALVASRPHHGWSHYHLSLMILPQYRSSVILNLFRVSQQKSADCFDFVQMQIFQRILIEITEFDDFFLKTSSVIFDLFRV